MTRIFFTLSLFSLVLVIAALVLGLSLGGLHRDVDAETLRWAAVHRLTGLAAALAVVFVNSIVVTYFIGTSRWCKEVVETYRLDRSLIVASTQLKRRAFPWALMNMLMIVVVIALGAAADPGTGRAGTEQWGVVHLYGALAGVAFLAFAYYQQWTHIRANHDVIQQVMAQVTSIREQRGLEKQGSGA